MADVTREQVVEFLSGLNVLEISELVSELEEKWGVSAAAPVAVAAAGGGDAGGAAAEQTEFDVVLTDFGGQKIKVIKAVREITGLGLKDAKGLVESAPKAVKEATSKEDAESIKAKLEEAGATAEIK